MAVKVRRTVVRVRGLPALDYAATEAALRKVIDSQAEEDSDKIGPYKISILPDCTNDRERVALVDFPNGLPEFLAELRQNPLGSWQAEFESSRGDEEAVSFDRHFHGFTQLYTTDPLQATAADIIAICGIDGHAYGSWQGRGNMRRMWLRHFLAKDLPACRTMIYGYEAKLSKRSFATTEDYVRDFLEDIKQIRSGELCRRPVIFVAHSYGGLILARTLIHAAQCDSSGDPAIVSLYKATYGIVFFAVPHRGLDVSDMARIMGEETHPRTGLLQHISVESEQLLVQLENFTKILGDRKVVSFFETEQSQRLERNEDGEWRRTGDYFTSLEAESAILQLPEHIETRLPLHCDHSAIVKYDSKHDVGYKRMLPYLEAFMKEASSVVEKRFDSNAELRFNLPFKLQNAPSADGFVGRERELSAMTSALLYDGSRKVVILHGPGGIGKTQLAIEYARLRQKEYSSVLWMNGQSEESLQQSFSDIIKRLVAEHPTAAALRFASKSQDLEEVVNGVKQWLDAEGNSRWLMIIDDVEDPDNAKTREAIYDVRSYLPWTSHGHVLITTRSSRLRIGQLLQVGKISERMECLKVLQGSSGIASIAQDSTELVNWLGGIPLALSIAGAYLGQVPVCVKEYMEELNQSRTTLEQSVLALTQPEMNILWELSLSQVERRSKAAIKLLKLCAYLNNQDLWYELFGAGQDEAPEWFQSFARSKASFHAHMRVLCDYKLAELGAESESYRIPCRIHDWVRDSMLDKVDREEHIQMMRQALACISKQAIADDRQVAWIRQRRLLGHASHWIRHFMSHMASNSDTGRQLLNLGVIYRWQGKLAEADTMYARALEILDETLGSEHVDTLQVAFEYGCLHHDRNKFNEAEVLFMRALEGFAKVKGTQDLSTVNTYHELARVYVKQGKHAEAEVMYKRALQGYEKKLGEEHEETLRTCYNLAHLLRITGKPDEAEALYKRTLMSQEKVFGPEHERTLVTVNNLGMAYNVQNKLAEAEAMFMRALEGKIKVFGPDHESTKVSVANLSRVRKQRKIIT